MIDAIIYVENFQALVTYLNKNYPDMLQRDENNKLTQPPVVTGFARTPAVVNGNSLVTYVRLTVEQAEQWRDMPHVEVLAEVEYHGKGTSQAITDQVFNDPEKLTKYKSVYDYTPYEITDEETGEPYSVIPPKMFGIMAGA